MFSTEDGVGGIDFLDEVSLDEFPLLGVKNRIFKVGDIAANVVCTSVLQRAGREVECTTICADVINHQNLLALEVNITNHIETHNLASLPIPLLDAKGKGEI